jgi:hypothetical protein
MLLAVPAAGFATVPVAGKDCVELEHADKAAEKTAMAVSRGRFNASTFHERSAMGCRGYVAWERLTSWVRAISRTRLKWNPKTPSAAAADSATTGQQCRQGTHDSLRRDSCYSLIPGEDAMPTGLPILVIVEKGEA